MIQNYERKRFVHITNESDLQQEIVKYISSSVRALAGT